MPRGDGLLGHDLDPGREGPAGRLRRLRRLGLLRAPTPNEVAKLTYFGLYALQHRGQESAGIAVSNGSQILVYKDMGLVAQVFDEGHLSALRGHLAIGHTRYSTTGSSVWENAQPTFRSTAAGSIALGHNGNLTNTGELARAGREARRRERPAALRRRGPDQGRDPPLARGHAQPRRHAQHHRHRDRHGAARRPTPTCSLEQAALEVLPQLRGAFSLVFMDEDTLYAARDPQGVRPLVLGRLERGWVVASETAALDIVGAVVRPRDRAGRADRDRRARPAHPALRRADAQGLPLRVRLPGAAGHPDRRPRRARDPRRGRPPARRGGAGRGRPGHPGARVGHPGRGRLLAGLAASRTASGW